MDDESIGKLFREELAKGVATYFYKTSFDGFSLMSCDILFADNLNNGVICNFEDIPMPTSATVIDRRRAIFHLATLDTAWINSSFWLRFVVRVEQANGTAVSINGHAREEWKWILDALGPVEQWEDYGCAWPNPATS